MSEVPFKKAIKQTAKTSFEIEEKLCALESQLCIGQRLEMKHQDERTKPASNPWLDFSSKRWVSLDGVLEKYDEAQENQKHFYECLRQKLLDLYNDFLNVDHFRVSKKWKERMKKKFEEVLSQRDTQRVKERLKA